MADKKKDDKKAPSASPLEEIILFMFVVLFATIFLSRFNSFFPSGGQGLNGIYLYFEAMTGGQNGWLANTVHYINVAVSTYVTIATIFSIITFLVILYVVWLTSRLFAEEAKKEKLVPQVKDLPSLEKQRWQKVVDHVNSQNPAEWRLSILEADVMLDEMLQKVGFHGDTIGERLKSVTKADFKNLDLAWEAHKIRNAIAHEGVDFLLSQRESKRIIGLYEIALKEFSYI
jgi:hypothetical protein